MSNRCLSGWETLRYVARYNHQLPQPALGSKTPMRAMKAWYQEHPDLFHIESASTNLNPLMLVEVPCKSPTGLAQKVLFQVQRCRLNKQPYDRPGCDTYAPLVLVR